MAIRQVREIGDDILTKQCKDVPKMTLRTKILISDMLETMYEYHGVGLAAPQVGVLKRIVVIDVGEGPIVLINPEIIETSGEQTGEEGCLSVPGKWGIVTRPDHVKERLWTQSTRIFCLRRNRHEFPFTKLPVTQQPLIDITDIIPKFMRADFIQHRTFPFPQFFICGL